MALSWGDLKEAKKLFQQALFINQEIGDATGAAINLANLATAAQKEKNLPLAEDYLQEARDLARQSGSAKVKGQVLCQMAGLALDQQDFATAAALLEEAKPLAREAEVKGAWHYSREGFFWQGVIQFKPCMLFKMPWPQTKTFSIEPVWALIFRVWEEPGRSALIPKAFLYYSRAFELYAATNSHEKAQFCMDAPASTQQNRRSGPLLKPYEQQLEASKAATAPCPPPVKITEPGNLTPPK